MFIGNDYEKHILNLIIFCWRVIKFKSRWPAVGNVNNKISISNPIAFLINSTRELLEFCWCCNNHQTCFKTTNSHLQNNSSQWYDIVSIRMLIQLYSFDPEPLWFLLYRIKKRQLDSYSWHQRDICRQFFHYSTHL